MINLLPPQEKERLLLQRYEKLTTILGWVVLIFLTFLTLVLFSVKFYILAQAAYQEEILANVKNKYQTPDFLFFKDAIQKQNFSLEIADAFYKKEFYVSDVLKIISKIDRPAGVRVNDIVIDRQREPDIMLVSMSATSDTRDDLVIFKNTVEKDERVKNLSFPPSNWIKPADINFYMTFEIHSTKN